TLLHPRGKAARAAPVRRERLPARLHPAAALRRRCRRSRWLLPRDAPRPRPRAVGRAEHGAARSALRRGERGARDLAAGAGGGPCIAPLAAVGTHAPWGGTRFGGSSHDRR